MPRSDATATRILSCTPCRDSKVKCIRVDDSSHTCIRCTRKKIHCTRDRSKRRFTSGHVLDSAASSPVVRGRQTLSPRHGSHIPNASNSIASNTDPRSGLPSLSNPFKLLAQASDGNEQETIFNTLGPPQDRVRQSLQVAQTVETSDVAKWKACFSAGLYTPRFESGSGYDPIACGILSNSRAAALYHTYMDQYNDGNVLLDPDWHTFEYIKMHSLLSSALYIVVARQEVFEGAEEMSDRLDDHIRQKLIPDIVLQGYRSVEIVLGMLFLATFHFSTQYIFDDQSWTYLGHAIRIGTELDINSRIASKALSDQDESVIRRYRAQERAWIAVYLTQQYFCLQTGRRAFLCTEGVIEKCEEDWHLALYSGKDDVFAIAHLQLRKLYNIHRTVFNRLCNQDDRQSGAGMSRRDLSYYLSRVQEDVKAWFNRFKDSDDNTLRACRIRLLLNHTKVMLFSPPLQDTKGSIESAKPAIVNLYEATIAYLGDLTGSNPLYRLGRGHNSIFVNGCYVAVMALKLSTLADRLSWIDIDRLFSLVEETSIRFSKEGRGPKQKKANSQAYGEYLQWLLGRYRHQQAQNNHRQSPLQDVSQSYSFMTHSGTAIGNDVNQEHSPYFVLPSSLNQFEQRAQQDGTLDLQQDNSAFSDDNDFFAWAQRYLNES